MTSREKYLRELTWELRWRRLPEGEVADVVREVGSELKESGAQPDQAFGPARTYATTFPKGRAMSRGYTVATVGIVVAVLTVLARVIGSVVTDGPSDPWVSLCVYAVALVVALLSAGLGAHLDRKLPVGIG